jgi:hypothetical protein
MWRIVCTIITVAMLAGTVLAVETEGPADFKQSPVYEGIASGYIITSAAKGQLRADGVETVVVGFRQAGESVDLSGGLLILRWNRVEWVPTWGAWFDGFYPSGITVAEKIISMKLVKTTMSGERSREYRLEYGKDFLFIHDGGGLFDGTKVRASSTLDRQGVRAENVFDGDLKTAWAEGSAGTGIDDWISLQFKKPQDIGMVGVMPGLFNGKGREWKDSNRLQRGELKLEISEEKSDKASRVDFEKDLGLTISGDTIEMSFPNRPSVRFYEVRRKGVKELKIVITSVFLGDKNDDTYISEIIPFQYIAPAPFGVDNAVGGTEGEVKKPEAGPGPAAKSGEKVDKKAD